MAVGGDTSRTSRPSLFAAIRLARLVLRFRQLLKSRSKIRAESSSQLCQAFGRLAVHDVGRYGWRKFLLKDMTDNQHTDYPTTLYRTVGWRSTPRCFICVVLPMDSKLTHLRDYLPIASLLGCTADRSCTQTRSTSRPPRESSSMPAPKYNSVLRSATVTAQRASPCLQFCGQGC